MLITLASCHTSPTHTAFHSCLCVHRNKTLASKFDLRECSMLLLCDLRTNMSMYHLPDQDPQVLFKTNTTCNLLKSPVSQGFKLNLF